MIGKINQNVKAAGYYRLSRDDGDKVESDSITNQKMLVSDFADRYQVSIIDDYIDDGYSGTNFERPDFNRLMADISDGKINCIVVKDLSRLGRNYIEMGRYITKIFPSMGVRLISINDNYDSLSEEDASNYIIVPFKNLINDAYCRDISIKIRSQLDIKRKNGQYIGSFALFGYKKDEENHNHLVIDETAAEIVQLIFNMKLDGYSSIRICKRLNEMGIPTPLEYKRSVNPTYTNGFKSKINSGWGVSSIDMILKNEMYTGVMIQGKRRKVNYKVKQSINMSEEDWIKVSETHDAIIPKEIFEIVKRLYSNDTRISPQMDHIYALSGLVKCGECGCNMIRRSTTCKGKKYYYYHCKTYKNGEGCSSHLISDKDLMKVVRDSIQNVIDTITNLDFFGQEIKDLPNNRISIKLIDNQIKGQKQEIDRYTGLKTKLYQDLCDEFITREEFRELNKTFSEKIKACEESISENLKKKEKIAALNIDSVPWIKALMQYKSIEKLDNRLAVSIIESIVVYDKDRIEINYMYGEEFNALLDIISESRKEITA